jgi:hypothetical protein
MATGPHQDPNLLDGSDLLRHETHNPATKKQKPFFEGKTHIMSFEVDCGLPLVGYARISLADLVNWKEFTM